MNALKHSQRGTTLFVTMIFLVVITLFGVSAINTSSMNLRIAGNMQFQQQAMAAAQQGIETAMGNLTTFTTPAAQSVAVDINKDGVTDYTAAVAAATCHTSQVASGYSAEYCALGSCPLDTNWEIQSTVNDSATGAKVVIHQGVKIRLPGGGTCPS